jgi:large subunit ribosomal protein L23
MRTPYDIIIKPVITEASMSYGTASKANAGKQVKYTFKVCKTANKTQIKNAIEEIFEGIKVDCVNTMNVKGKLKRQGKTQGYTSSWKKAIITLAEGSKEIGKFEGI